MGDAAFESGLAAIDAVNAADPAGTAIERSEAVRAWVTRLDPEHSDIQILAAKAHHLGRWKYPRSEFPEGRAGYLRWRREAARKQAQELSEILTLAGYGPSETSEATTIVRKAERTHRPDVQTHEDALCLVFIEFDLAEFLDRHGEGKAIDVLASTMKKMSPAALEQATRLNLASELAGLIEKAALA